MRFGRSSLVILLCAAILGIAGTISADDLAEDSSVHQGRAWWAFQPVKRPNVPGKPQNPIDAFITVAQQQTGVTAAAEADKATLIRRLTFDLMGLPPSPEEIEAFLADQHENAYERLVDRLLDSPAYGERWARFWLDLVRYADSDGFELDTKRPNAWRYRDWVVNALNEDMPFDRFIRLQLAADEIESDQPEQLAALGFLRNGPSVGNQKNEKLRMDELDDVVSTTSSVFLGLTVACARCHDHKFDPIPAEDYYRLVAVFAPGTFAEIPLASRAEVERYQKQLQDIQAALDRLEAQKRAAVAEKDEEVLSPMERSVKAEWEARIAALEASRPAPLPKVLGVTEAGARPGPVHLLVRGNVDQKGKEVWPGPPRVVAGEVIDFLEAPRRARSSFRRAALARWIASAENPLTARVQVNRLWQGHFGKGLVPTPSDFGTMGEQPALPELLEWLAAEFVSNGWSQKAIHRLIVTSRTYRQSSAIRAENQEIDPENAFWWRYPMRRLDAEEIRDAILSCAGTLNTQRGGPGVFPPIDRSIIRTGNEPRWPLRATERAEVWRRSLYIFQMRSVPLPLLEVFDLPPNVQSCPERSRTTIPTQSLSLLNNPFVLEQSRHFAERVARQAGTDPAARIDRAFLIATGKPPAPAQRAATLEFLKRQTERQQGTADPELSALADVCHVLYNSNAFLYVD